MRLRQGDARRAGGFVVAARPAIDQPLTADSANAAAKNGDGATAVLAVMNSLFWWSTLAHLPARDAQHQPDAEHTAHDGKPLIPAAHVGGTIGVELEADVIDAFQQAIVGARA